jgi:hypothetical protein
MSSAQRSTQLTEICDGYDTNKLLFGKPEEGSIPDTTITYKRIRISTVYDNGSVGPLIIPTERLFSFGVQVNKDPKTKKPNGHVMCHNLYSNDGATDREDMWVNNFTEIINSIKTNIIDNCDEYGLYDYEYSDLKKFNPIYKKRDNGKLVEGSDKLYTKLIEKKNGTILTTFTDNDTNEDTNPLDLLGKFCYTNSAILIESIFIGSKPTLQIKLYESVFELVGNARKRLLRPTAKPFVSSEQNISQLLDDEKTTDEKTTEDNNEKTADDNDGSLSDSASESEEEEPVKKLVRKKVVRRRKPTQTQ